MGEILSGGLKRHPIRARFNSGFMRKMIASLMLAALLPTIACAVLCYGNYTRAYQRETLLLETGVKQTAVRLSSELTKIDATITSVLQHSDMLETATLKGGQAAKVLYKFIQTRANLSLLTQLNSIVDDIMLINATEGLSITSDIIHLDAGLFKRSMSLKYAGYDWDGALNWLYDADTSLKREYFLIPNADGLQSALAYGVTYVRKSNPSRIHMLFILSPESVKRLIGADAESEYAVFWNDSLITSGVADDMLISGLVNRAETLEDGLGRRYIGAEQMLGGLRVVAVKRFSVFIANVRALLTGMFALIAGMLAFSLFLCVYVAYMNSRPFDKLLYMLFDHNLISQQRKYNWELLDASVRALLADNQSLKTTIQTQTDAMISSLLYELALNRNCNRRAVLSMLIKLGLQVDENYWVALIEVSHDSGDADPALKSLMLKRLMEKHVEGLLRDFPIGTDRQLLLIRASGRDSSALRTAFEALAYEAEDVAQFTLRAAATGIRSLKDVHEAYFEASMLIDLSERGDEFILFAEDSPMGLAEYEDYPAHWGDGLTKAVREGNRDKVFECLDDIERQNRPGGVMTDKALHKLRDYLYLDIGNALLRQESAPEDMVTATLKDLNALNSSDEYRYYFTRLKYLLEPVLNAIRENSDKGQPRGSALGEAITAFIRGNISNPNLSLSMLADRFKLSESYISNMIKCETGAGFLNFCEGLRMELACELITNGASINDVAALTGYNSPHTFRRAFKKVMGVAPTQYASQNK